MKFEKLLFSVNHLITNNFYKKNFYLKIYVCHYLISTYFITKNIVFLNASIDLLQETLKLSYLVRNKQYADFLFVVNYTTSICNSFGIELDIEEIIVGTLPSKNSYILSSKSDVDLLEVNSTEIFKFCKNKFLFLIVLYQLRTDKINYENWKFYNSFFYENYCISGGKKDFLFCSFLIQYYFNKKNLLKTSIPKLVKGKEKYLYSKIVDLLLKRGMDEDNYIDMNLNNLLNHVNRNERFYLVVIYYSLFYEKTKYCFD